MIEIKNLYKKYKEDVLKGIDLQFPDNGLFCIVGPSGCGKSTLLNIIYGNIREFKGQLIINNKFIKSFNENELNNFKLENIGYVHQNFNLIDDLLVEDNILLHLETTQNVSNIHKRKLLHKISKECEIENLLKSKTKDCSGGEKQRIAIAKAIINSPSIVLADEPTGNLDEENSNKIFNLLQNISKNRLVIVVTHDLDLANKYSNQIIYLKDGKIIKQTKKKNKTIKEDIWTHKKANIKNVFNFPFRFSYRYSNEHQKSHKLRSLIFNISMTLATVISGFSMMFSSSISNHLTSTFKGIINENNILMRHKNEYINYNSLVGANINILNSLINDYPKEIDSYGYKYLVNFENFFIDRNEFYIASTANKIVLDSFSIRNINEYKTLDNIDNNVIFYPEKKLEMEMDEISLGLSYQTMSNLCYSLGIARTYNSLGIYLSMVETYIGIGVKNHNWNYEDDQYFRLVNVYETKTNEVMHTSNIFNKYVFEDVMRFPISESLLESYVTPWIMKRIPILRIKEDPDDFINQLMYEDKYSKLILDKDSYTYSPYTYSKNEISSSKDLFVFYSDFEVVDMRDVKYIVKEFPVLSNYIISNDYSYMCLENMMIQGFTRPIIFSNGLVDITSLSDALSKGYSINEIEIPSNVAIGSVLKSNDEGVKLSSEYKKPIKGKFPTSINEIAITTKLQEKLSLNDFNRLELRFSSFLDDEYKIKIDNKIKICGVIESNDNLIYCHNDFSLSLFRKYLGVSNLYLVPSKIIFYNEDVSKNDLLIEQLSILFPDYIFTNPLKDLANSTNETMKYINNLSNIFAILTIIISLVLLISITYLDVIDKAKDINIFKFYGYGKYAIANLISFNTLIISSLSSLSSISILVVIEIFMSYMFSSYFGNTFVFSVNLLPILMVAILAILISYFASFSFAYILIQKQHK